MTDYTLVVAVILAFAMGMTTLLSITVPLVLNYLKDKRTADQEEQERKRLAQAASDQNGGLHRLLGWIIETDAIMDYVHSRGNCTTGELPSTAKEVLEILKGMDKKEG